MQQFEPGCVRTEQKGKGSAERFLEQIIGLLPRLSAFALCLTGNSEQHDDLVQATYARALGRRDQWQPGAHLDAWMLRIALNLWFDRKRAKRFRSEPIDIDYSAGSDARAVTESRLVPADLLTALDKLAPEHRAMIALVCVDDLSYTKAAEVLSLPVGTVMSRLARARLALYEAANAAIASKATRH
jgi:RNA polymerase sigma-70 factor (ECF subfamily)